MRRFNCLSEIPAVVLILGVAAAPILAVWSSDFDGDSDVDLTDFGELAACFNGPNRAPAAPCAVDADLDNDSDIDLADFAIFAACFHGPNHPPACPGDPIPPGMVLIPGGQFDMGDTFNEEHDYERPVHAVWLDAFYMDKYEVTNQQYADALNWAYAQGGQITVASGVVYKYNSGTSFPYCHTTTSLGSLSRITWDGSTFGVVAGYENHPMVLVSWYGTLAFCNWRGAMEARLLAYDLSTWECNFSANSYRLPTESEWEKAARGGAAGHRFPWSDSDFIQHARANYYSSTTYAYDTSPTRHYHPTFAVGSPPHTSPVGYFASNAYGLYDMAGNVWEWCNDWYSFTYYQWCVDNCTTPCPNPRGPTSGTYRVVRGGCWGGNAASCRVAFRTYAGPDGHGGGYGGFRCVAGIP